MLSSVHVMVGHIFSISSSIRSYLDLHAENNLLFERNGQLELEILKLHKKLEQLQSGMLTYDAILTDSIDYPYRFTSANVVNNSITGLHNYITIDKGSQDNIEVDMAVVSVNGVVGVVSTVRDHFSVVLPLLNVKSKLSCKVKRMGDEGSLVWDGRDSRYSNLEELALHAEFEVGDTIVTSGHSAIFPPGLIVGWVEEQDQAHSHNFYSLKIKLATDFVHIKTVRVIKYDYQKERLAVEQEAKRND
jgi:rod shape-determining protein MreC